MKTKETGQAKGKNKNTICFGKLLAVLCLLLLASAVLSLSCGSVKLSLSEMIAVFFGGSNSAFQGDAAEKAAAIVLYSRLPRTVGALLAGAALAAAGTIIQEVLNNPLAAPNIIGVNAGAGAMVTLCGAALPASVCTSIRPLAAFGGALAGVLLVLLIAEKTGASRLTLVLAGLVVSSIFSAVTDLLLTLSPDALHGYTDFRIGGLAGVPMDRLEISAVIILPVLLAVILLADRLEVLTLGSETAQSLGMNVKQTRIVFLALAAALAGSVVSFAGLIGFVGIVVPHVMRRFTGEESRLLLISSALAGAVFLTLCDVLARVVSAPYELSVGILLSFIGGPFFLCLLIRQRGGRTHD